MSHISQFSRRDFLKQTVIATTSGLSTTAALASQPSDEPVFDVIVVGYGAAGACAAIEAHNSKASVLIVEKASSKEHCSTSRLSSGIYQCPDASIESDILKDYITSTYFPNGAKLRKDKRLPQAFESFAETWAQLAPQTFEWFCDLDPDFRTASSPLFTTSRFVNLWHGIRPHIHARIATYSQWNGFTQSTYQAPKHKSMNGEALYLCLNKGITDRGIPVKYDSPLQTLLLEHGKVTGVQVKTPEGVKTYRARKGVIIATGGFAFNASLRKSLLPAAADQFWACTGSPENTGDGIISALKVGASLVKSSAFFDRFCILLPEKRNGVRLGIPLECLGRPHTLLVDNFGERFIAESDLQDIHQHYGYLDQLLTFDDVALGYPYGPSWCIFDEMLMQQHPVATLGEGSTVCGVVNWIDNQHALKQGWILTGNTIDELARQIAAHPDNAGRMSAENLNRTLNTFNVYASAHHDRQFDRSPSTMSPLAEGPYYAVPVSVDIPHMGAGLATDKHRQVVDWLGNPIPGLFAAGEVAPVSRFMHDKGGHLSECLVFGRFVGQYVARL